LETVGAPLATAAPHSGEALKLTLFVDFKNKLDQANTVNIEQVIAIFESVGTSV
jgi:hypothetical protein